MDLTHLRFVLLFFLKTYSIMYLCPHSYQVTHTKYPLLTYYYLTFNIEIQANSVVMIVMIK